jgi:hypothetical protein
MLRVVREYKRKNPTPKSPFEESISKALASVTFGDVGCFQGALKQLQDRIAEIHFLQGGWAVSRH